MAANRIADGARSAFAHVRSTHKKVTENLAEYFVEENPLLVPKMAVEDFTDEVTRLRDDVERAAKRIARLEQKLAQGAVKNDTPAPSAGQINLDY